MHPLYEYTHSHAHARRTLQSLLQCNGLSISAQLEYAGAEVGGGMCEKRD